MIENKCPRCNSDIILKTKEIWECTYHIDSDGTPVNDINTIVLEVLEHQYVCEKCEYIVKATN